MRYINVYNNFICVHPTKALAEKNADFEFGDIDILGMSIPDDMDLSLEFPKHDIDDRTK